MVAVPHADRVGNDMQCLSQSRYRNEKAFLRMLLDGFGDGKLIETLN